MEITKYGTQHLKHGSFASNAQDENANNSFKMRLSQKQSQNT